MIHLEIQWADDADQSLGLPRYETAGSAGADLRANFGPDLREQGVTLAPMQRALIPTGLRMAVPQGYEVQIRPRSGLALKQGVSIPNAPGTIDSDYRGTVGVILINLGTEPVQIAHGDRVAQMVVAPVVQAQFQVVATLNDTARGSGGFGSTGKH